MNNSASKSSNRTPRKDQGTVVLPVNVSPNASKKPASQHVPGPSKKGATLKVVSKESVQVSSTGS